MKLLSALAIVILCGLPAFGQEQADPRAQVLANRLLTEINSNIACETSAIQLRQALVNAQNEAKRLKDKYEPAAPAESDPAKP